MRRGVNMVYIVENNGVYGLTKGQFSATADARLARASAARSTPTRRSTSSAWRCMLGATLRRPQLLRRQGAARAADQGRDQPPRRGLHRRRLPCVAFNNHPGSTKSFDYVREHNEAVNRLDVIVAARARSRPTTRRATVEEVTQHDGSVLRLRKLAADYDPHDRVAALAYLQERHAAGEIVTGLLYIDPEPRDLHDQLGTVDTPLNRLTEAELCPGSAGLDAFNAARR